MEVFPTPGGPTKHNILPFNKALTNEMHTMIGELPEENP